VDQEGPGGGDYHQTTQIVLFSMPRGFRNAQELFQADMTWLEQRGMIICHLVDRTSVLVSNLSNLA